MAQAAGVLAYPAIAETVIGPTIRLAPFRPIIEANAISPIKTPQAKMMPIKTVILRFMSKSRELWVEILWSAQRRPGKYVKLKTNPTQPFYGDQLHQSTSRGSMSKPK